MHRSAFLSSHQTTQVPELGDFSLFDINLHAIFLCNCIQMSISCCELFWLLHTTALSSACRVTFTNMNTVTCKMVSSCKVNDCEFYTYLIAF